MTDENCDHCVVSVYVMSANQIYNGDGDDNDDDDW